MPQITKYECRERTHFWRRASRIPVPERIRMFEERYRVDGVYRATVDRIGHRLAPFGQPRAYAAATGLCVRAGAAVLAGSHARPTFEGAVERRYLGKAESRCRLFDRTSWIPQHVPGRGLERRPN